MRRLTLAATDFIRMGQAALEVPPGRGLLWGDNGFARTSRLEVMFGLGQGHSSLTRNNASSFGRTTDRMRVIGRATDGAGSARAPGLGASRGILAWRAGQAGQSRVATSQAFATPVIEPGVHRLVGGACRRGTGRSGHRRSSCSEPVSPAGAS